MRGISTRQFGHVTSPTGRPMAPFSFCWGWTSSASGMALPPQSDDKAGAPRFVPADPSTPPCRSPHLTGLTGGAPRPMKMGTIVSPWRDEALKIALRPAGALVADRSAMTEWRPCLLRRQRRSASPCMNAGAYSPSRPWRSRRTAHRCSAVERHSRYRDP
jgi:hypothetical protein